MLKLKSVQSYLLLWFLFLNPHRDAPPGRTRRDDGGRERFLLIQGRGMTSTPTSISENKNDRKVRLTAFDRLQVSP